ncbi:MMPL family transporter [Streptoalloteichus hindustanus]|uniref:Putative drug exporter of the RND superfamily n=1 Tax=Streptoalloteichus hindustanus TaxID=2017 RepID=A0A1M5CIJ7_STRHI|nr:MMPL family transporter [Streptoalloteichus hindustanus]SHF54242.1 putative drug exporter of the RND superfamily [Streptoalloteichus hindustanus]
MNDTTPDGTGGTGACSRPGRLFYRLGRASASRRGLVLAGWLAVVVLALGGLPHLLGSLGPPALSAEGSESARADALVAGAFPGWGQEQAVVVFRSATLTVDDPAYRQAVAMGLAALREQPGVGVVILDPPFLTAATRGRADRHVTLVFTGLLGDAPARNRQLALQQTALRQTTRDTSHGQVEASLVNLASIYAELHGIGLADLRRAELVALPVAALILLAAMGALRWAAAAMLFGAAAVTTVVGVLALATAVVTVDTLMLAAAVTLGWGLGLDYAILMIFRYRAERALGHDPEEAAARATATTGVTVALASLAVIICGACLFVVRAAVVRESAVTLIIVAALTGAAALTLLPALLPSVSGRAERPAGVRPDRDTRWARWARHLMRHPWRYALAAATVLSLSAAPALSLRLGLDIDRSVLATTPAGQSLLAMEREGVPTVISVLLPRQEGAAPPEVRPLLTALRAEPGVTSVAHLDNGRDTSWISVVPSMSADAPAGQDLVRRLRAHLLPAHLPPGQQVLVGGPVAQLTDFQQEITSKLWWLVGLALAGSGAYLVAAFRSLVLPAKALAMNVLAVGASYGLVTVAFQPADSAPDRPGVLNFFVPVITFVILFALSTDYEVFLVRRIQEHHRRHGDTTEAVAAGLHHTARPITAAALVMVVVFTGLLSAHRAEIRQIGFALAVAIAIDATVVRLVLVPALMQLFGRYNWWLPAPLVRLLDFGPVERKHPAPPDSGDGAYAR